MRLIWKTWANLITGLGFLGVILYVWAYSNQKDALVLPFFVFTSLTDFFDGQLARRLNQVTKIGTIIDPIRDRFFILATLFNIIIVYGFNVIAMGLGLILVFELIIGYVNIKRGLPQPVHFFGKLRGAISYILLGLILLFYYHIKPMSEYSVEIIFYVIAIFSFLALIGYLFFNKKPASFRGAGFFY
jgi:cardiolipin synthase